MAPTPVDPPVFCGLAGGSAAAEFARRHDARRARIQTAHPKIGSLLLAVVDDPQSTRAWSTGAQGEQAVGSALGSIVGPGLRVLNDRCIPRSRANIDHIVVSRAGVFVVDAKLYRDRRPERRVEGGLLRERVESLWVGGRNRTNLVEGVLRQVGHVRRALHGLPDVEVTGVLCFVDSDWPLLGGIFEVRHVLVTTPRKLKRLVAKPGPMDEELISEVQVELQRAFPAKS